MIQTASLREPLTRSRKEPVVLFLVEQIPTADALICPLLSVKTLAEFSPTTTQFSKAKGKIKTAFVSMGKMAMKNMNASPGKICAIQLLILS